MAKYANRDREEDWWLPVEGIALEVSDPKSPSGISDIAPIDVEPVTDRLAFERPGRFRRTGFRVSLWLEQPVRFLRGCLQKEQEAGGSFLWSPVLFGTGCVIYFNLPREPLPFAFALVCLIAAAFAWWLGQGGRLYSLLVAFALVTGGVATAQWQARSVATPMLSKIIIAQVTGTVTRAEYRADGSARYTIKVRKKRNQSENSKRRKDLPPIIRVTARKGSPVFGVGQGIEGRVRVGPPPGPAFPGSYDFSFQTWFDGIGASGFFLGKPKAAAAIVSDDSESLWLAQARSAIGGIIRDALPGRSGGLASALIVGDRSGIDDETNLALRRSGLAHILAISGLHMALVSVTVLFCMRGLFSLYPSICLHYPVKKWASCVALVVATIYLLLSGASVSTQRAWIMVAIMLLAVLFDRRALTMRNVAIAALVVLFISPEAVLSPGFQMSFGAVAGLIACYEVLMKVSSKGKRSNSSGIAGVIRKFLFRDMAGLATTSLVAGLATGLFAAYHFYRVAPLGLLANLLAMPLVTFAVMPAALLGVVLMPFGLEAAPLMAMAYSMDWVVAVATWVASIDQTGSTGLIPASAVLFGSGALLVLCLSRSWLKFAAFPLAVLAAIMIGERRFPDVLILESGNQIGILEPDGELRLLKPNSEKFSTGIWKEAFVANASSVIGNGSRGQAGPGFLCDDYGCTTHIKGKVIAHITNTTRLFEDCQLADVIVLPWAVPNACSALQEDQRPLIIDRTILDHYGSHALTIVHPPAKVGNAQSLHGEMQVSRSYQTSPRPWTRHRAVPEQQGQ